MAKKEKMVFNDDREPGSSGGDRGTDEAAPGFLDYPNSNFRGGGDKNGHTCLSPMKFSVRAIIMTLMIG